MRLSVRVQNPGVFLFTTAGKLLAVDAAVMVWCIASTLHPVEVPEVLWCGAMRLHMQRGNTANASKVNRGRAVAVALTSYHVSHACRSRSALLRLSAAG